MRRGAIVWLLSSFVIALVSAPAAKQEQAQAPNDEVYTPGNGVSMPSVLRQVDPQYTPAARTAKIEGTVKVKAVIEADGRTDRITVIKSLDKTYGLDDEAVKAAKQWAFAPAKKDGKPVSVWVTIELEFRLFPGR